MNKIRLVQGDTRPQLVVSLKDSTTGNAIDLSPAGTEVHLKFRMLGYEALTATLIGTRLPGYENEDGSINNAPPYNVPGRGGRCVFQFVAPSLDGEPGDYEGEIEIIFSDGTIQTVYDTLKFKMRQDF